MKIDIFVFTYLTCGYQYELKFDLEKSKFSTSLGSHIEAGVNISASLGVSIPAEKIIGVSFEVGIKGIAGYGKLSIDLSLDIYNLLFSFNLYFELILIKMEFYIKMKIFLHIVLIDWEKSFSLYQKDIELKRKIYPILSFNHSFTKDKNILQILNIQ